MVVVSTDVPTAPAIPPIPNVGETGARGVVDATKTSPLCRIRHVSIVPPSATDLVEVVDPLLISRSSSLMKEPNLSTASTEAFPAAQTASSPTENSRGSPHGFPKHQSLTPTAHDAGNELPVLSGKKDASNSVSKTSHAKGARGLSRRLSSPRSPDGRAAGAGRVGRAKESSSKTLAGGSSRRNNSTPPPPSNKKAGARPTSASRPGKGLRAASPSRRSPGGTLSPVRRNSPQGSKQKRRKIFQALFITEEKERAKVYEAYETEWNQMILIMSIQSFEPQRRALLYLQDELKRVREEYGARASRAENAVAMLTQGSVHLLETVSETAVKVLNETDLLEVVLPFSGQEIAVDGVTLPCSRNPLSNLTEAHNLIKQRDSQEQSEVERIKSFFSPLGHSAAAAASASDAAAAANDDSDATMAMNGNNVKNAYKVYDGTTHLTDFLAALLNRTHRMLQYSKRMNEVLQQALDENATRLKVADDILQETVAKRNVEVDSAVRLCGEFSMELRQRMDKMEKEVRDALNELIQRSATVSVDNNAFSDHAQLLHNKESTIQHYMSKMETVAVEQGKLLQEVRFKLLELWKRRSGDGDEERANLKHSGLPKAYRDALQECDRDTLLRLLHFLTLNSDDAPGLLVGAIDEHNNFLRGNTAEAQAVAQRSAVESAVCSLLEKLHEEGDIKQNPCRQGATLAETIHDMVHNYNTYMMTLERQQRRAARKRDIKETSSSRPFFDSRTPIPPEYAADLLGRPPLKTKRPAICDGKANRVGAESVTHDGHATVLNGSIQLGGFSGAKKAMSHMETCSVLNYMRRSHPSAFDPPGTASVVGFGRWGGSMAQCSDEGQSGNNRYSSSQSQHGAPDHCSPLNDTDRMATPPPGVPPRISIVQHVLEHHRQDLETLYTCPQMHSKSILGEDAPFLKLQRELLEAFQ